MPGTHNKSNAIKAVGQKFRSYDKFSAGRPAMRIDFEGTGPAYKSYMGAIVSISFILISAIFLFSKIMTLYNHSSITIMSVIDEGAID